MRIPSSRSRRSREIATEVKPEVAEAKRWLHERFGDAYVDPDLELTTDVAPNSYVIGSIRPGLRPLETEEENAAFVNAARDVVRDAMTRPETRDIMRQLSHLIEP